MRVSFEIGERHFLFLVGILAVVSAIGIVTGYGGTDPDVVGHTLGEIGAGTFSAGDYVFPDNLGVGGNLGVTGSIKLGDVSRSSWPVLTCMTKSESGGGEIYCDEGWTMTGGGCVWRSDGNDRYVYSHPYENGWRCLDYDGPVDSRYVRCCKIE